MINNLGATTAMELAIVRKKFRQWSFCAAAAAPNISDTMQHKKMLRCCAQNLGHSPQGDVRVRDLSGFDWRSGDVFWLAEKSLTPRRDRGTIPPERFRLEFWGVRPDFRFCTRDKTQQLIVEGKGTPCLETRDLPQARKYFEYLRDFPSKGAVIYLVPGDSYSWSSMLNKAAENTGIPNGILLWTKSFLQTLSIDLVSIIEESLVQAQVLLDKARSLASP